MRRRGFSLQQKQQILPVFFPRVRRVMIFGSLGIVCIILVSFFFYSRFFTIEYIDVVSTKRGIDPTGVRALAFAQMERSRFWVLPQRNIFIFSAEELKRALNRKFVLLRMKTQKRLPHTLSIELSGMPFRLIAVSGGRVFDMTPDGTVSAELTDEPVDGKPALALARQLATEGGVGAAQRKNEPVDAPVVLIPGENAEIDAVAVSFVRNIFEGSVIQKYHPLYFSLEQGTPTIRMKSAEGWSALFSLLLPADEQLNALRTIFDASFRKGRKNIDYIDVRFKNRAFYKKL